MKYVDINSMAPTISAIIFMQALPPILIPLNVRGERAFFFGLPYEL